MLTDDEAHTEVLGAWKDWKQSHVPHIRQPSGAVTFIFFGYLRSERPDLLEFRYNGDKWQQVHAWLLDAREVTDLRIDKNPPFSAT